jgi:hypothetical protein
MADASIAGSEFARVFEGNFQPETGKVQDAERTGGAGTD